MSDTPAAPGAAAAPAKRPTLAFQWGVLGILAAIACGMFTAGLFEEPTSRGYGPFDCFGAIVMILGQAMWVTMDCRRLGRAVGWWKFAVIVFGPPGLWAYLVSTYRVRALLWIPVSIAVYAATFLLPLGIALLLGLEL